MDHLASEQEQVDQLKRWWKDNGRSLVFGLVIGIGGLAGYRYWDTNQTQLAENASINYDMFLQMAQDQRVDDARKTGKSIVENYPNTTYARLSTLLLAKLAQDSGDHDEAAALLRSLLTDNKDSQIQHIASARLARLVLAEGNPAEAASLLAAIPDSNETQRFIELRGDVALANGDETAAREFYLAALEQATELGLERGAIQLKVDNLAAKDSSS